MKRHTIVALLAALSLVTLGVPGFTITARAQGIGLKPYRTFIVNTTTDAHDQTPGDGYCYAMAPALGKCTLRAAIEEANAGFSANPVYNIIVPAGHYYLTLGTLTIQGNTVNIYGNGATRTIIDASSDHGAARSSKKPGDVLVLCAISNGSVFHNDSNLSIQGAEITGGNHDYGGGVQNEGSLILNADLIDYNCANYGAGVNSSGNSNDGFSGAAQISNTEIAYNAATSEGGGVRNRGGKMTMDGDNVHDNYASNDGGGAWNDSYLSINNSNVHNNSTGSVVLCTGEGGGIWNNLHLLVTVTRILNNTSGDQGGGLFTSDYASLDKVTMSGNMAVDEGGGAWNDDRLYVSRSTISGNTAGTKVSNMETHQGGGIWSSDDVWLTDTKLTGNQAVGPSGTEGGGLWSDDENWFTNATFSSNTADYGGGIYFLDSYCGGCFATRLTLQGSTITGNTANLTGGGMYIEDPIGTPHPPAPVRINDTTITGNAESPDLYNPPGTAVCSGATTIGTQTSQC